MNLKKNWQIQGGRIPITNQHRILGKIWPPCNVFMRLGNQNLTIIKWLKRRRRTQPSFQEFAEKPSNFMKHEAAVLNLSPYPTNLLTVHLLALPHYPFHEILNFKFNFNSWLPPVKSSILFVSILVYLIVLQQKIPLIIFSVYRSLLISSHMGRSKKNTHKFNNIRKCPIYLIICDVNGKVFAI